MNEAQVTQVLIRTVQDIKPSEPQISAVTSLGELDLDSLDTLELLYALQSYAPVAQDNFLDIPVPADCQQLTNGLTARTVSDVFRHGTIGDLARIVIHIASQTGEVL
ncbi:hypothetical protein Sulac_0593 [Sulfobacillus acidophilus DSM 10332]|uniref:Carrier domain-containing protein n=1 Tax=Sulfobacillus acidophilus (strain ATCC 700253 / DSM 10332 / NAL) TaxID=679936 RepID=G8TZV2_SULAD|nr:hypothetical protein Sulac_0593 [Sulfobacillus acidophilus DSM 10332]